MHFLVGEDKSLFILAERSIFATFSSGALFSSLKSTVRRFSPRLMLFVGVVAPSLSGS